MKLKKRVLGLWKRSKSKDDSEPEGVGTVTTSSPWEPDENDSPSSSATRAPPIELGGLPAEILITIFRLTCETQEHYRNLLLTSKAFQAMAQSECFGHFPIRLQTEAQTRSFYHHLTNHSDLGPLVRYLWINGPRFEAPVYLVTIPEDSLPIVQYRTVEQLTGLKALVCPYHIFQYICNRAETHNPDLCNPKLQEVEILDTCNQSWGSDTYRLYSQITHLSLLEPCPEWVKPTQWKLFPNLVGFAFELHSRHPSALISSKNLREDDILRDVASSIEIAVTMAPTDSRRPLGFEMNWEFGYSIYCGKLRYYDRWLSRLKRNGQYWFLYHS